MSNEKTGLLSRVTAEFIGTFAIVFFACGSIMISERLQLGMSGATISLMFGMVVAAMVYAIGHISGAHFNPAVSFAFALARHFRFRDLLTYGSAQFAGGIAASAALYYLLPQGNSYGATVPSALISLNTAYVVEIILSFFLMFVVMSVATDTRAVGTMAGAAVGTMVTIAAIFGGPLTGASMNPARSFGPAIFEGELSVLWIYLTAPFVGMSVAALLYKWIRCGQGYPS